MDPIFSNDIKAIAKHAPKALLFLLPVFLAYAFPLFVFVRSGEHVSIRKIIALQKTQERPTLLGKAYTYPDPLYKWEATKQREPSVIALGTSRVLAFRLKFFKDGSSFFNAGKGVYVIEDFNTFLADIPQDHQPKLIIMGLDQHLFFKEHRGGSGLEAYRTEEPIFATFLTRSWRQIYLDFYKRKFTLKDFFQPATDQQAIGLTALVRHDGYRNDGSYQYGDPLKQPFEARKKIIDEVDAAITPTHCEEYGAEIAPETLTALSRFLQMARERHITVVGFVPPFAHQLLAKMQSYPDSVCATFIEKLPVEIKRMFSENQFEFFDFTDNTSFGGSDQEMIDATHASEKSYLRIYLNMLKNGQSLKPYSDGGFLEQQLKDAKGDLDVFGHTY